MQRIVQTLELVEDPALIADYKKAHDEIWPEIVEGIRSVGIEAMDIYLTGNQLVMVVELPDEVDFESAMTKLATLPRQQEWENHVAKYQVCDPGSTSSGKWRRLEQIFTLPK